MWRKTGNAAKPPIRRGTIGSAIRLFRTAFALLLAGPPAYAADAPILAAADMRPALDLSGPWHYSIDPYRDGEAGFHGGDPGTGHRRYDDVDPGTVMAADPTALYEYDLEQSPVANLPASWLTHAPALRHYQGLVWYERRFAAQPTPGTRAFLRFGAVNYRASVYLNGKLVGTHEGGFTPFAVEVTNVLRSGDNRLVVGADSVPGATSLPPPVTDWENYGGITRPVRLLTLPATFIDDVWIRLADNGRLAVDARLNGAGASDQPITLRMPELGLTLTGRTDAAGRWSATTPLSRGVQLWAPDHPRLYDVTVSTGEDQLHDRVGLRTIAVHGSQILLNGKPIFLRGISIHEEEFGSDPTRAITPAAARALLSEAKDGLHANYVRLAHYPHSEEMTRMADQLGLLVWSEIPIYWRVAFDDPGTLARARRMLAEEIERDRNRASIILWSVGNETPVSAARTHFLRTLASDVRLLDPSRLVTAALLTNRVQENGHPEMVMDDPLAADVDVLAINTYNGWYTPDRLADLPKIGWRLPADKPLVFSEMGADALAGFHDPARQHKFSEEFQADYYRATLAMAAHIPSLAGLSPWILKDFRSPRRQHPIYENGWNRKGLVSETGQRKEAFAVLAGVYAGIANGDAPRDALMSGANRAHGGTGDERRSDQQ